VVVQVARLHEHLQARLGEIATRLRHRPPSPVVH